MPPGTLAIAGSGMAGLCTALLLARDGRDVALVDRDPWTDGELEFEARRGVPHYLQPHAFIPRGRLEMSVTMPDVLEDLLAHGSQDVDLRRKLPGPTQPGDEALVYLAVRRPAIEAALRRAVDREPRIQVRPGTRVTGLRLDGQRVTGLRLADGVLDCDLVVDALGRRSCLRPQRSEAETTDCGVVYYSRYYRVRSGQELPDGPWFLSPRGDLGYLAYATFPGDNGTFAGLLAVPPGDPDWKHFRDADVFSAAVATIPALASWVNPDLAEPITDVMPMAGLRNVPPPRDFGVRGYLAVGDALAHTDPVLAHGLSFALIHARTLVTLLRHLTVGEVGEAFLAEALPSAQERFDFSSELDEQRLRMWRGEAVDFTRPDGDYALFSMAAAGAVAAVNPEVFRCFVRRIGLLDSTRVLDDDHDLQQLIAVEFARLARQPRPAGGPTRDAMVELVHRTRSS